MIWENDVHMYTVGHTAFGTNYAKVAVREREKSIWFCANVLTPSKLSSIAVIKRKREKKNWEKIFQIYDLVHQILSSLSKDVSLPIIRKPLHPNVETEMLTEKLI